MLNVECSRRFRHASRVTCHPQNGVALIITIILLGVVTFMAVAFLALSRRERGAVTTVTDTASARLAADAALANAEAQVMANVLSTTNPYNFGLLVSTNYINYLGFNNKDPLAYTNYNNVNYQYPGGGSLSINDFLQNLANLWYSPRPPVFIPNPTNSSLPLDFRYYLDLNRNGRFDANGLQIVISPDPAKPYYDTNGNLMATIIPGNTLSNVMVGDPEWIGVLQRPDQPYGPNNPFVARYAFIAVPVGNTLDLNAIYNQAMTRSVNPASGGADGFLRNQGVGSWEINLAAFLTDLNFNQWDTSTDPYRYLQPNNINTGRGFEDALSLLSYRYHYSYGTLTPVGGTTPNGLFTTANSFPPFQNNIDEFGNGPLMTNLSGINASGQDVTRRWAGADNTNHFFTPSELFNSNDISAPFVNSLLAAGNTNSTYDRYTFYRLLAQLGTDSTPDSGKMNLNYDNLDPFVTNAPATTNFMAWTPLAFFTNAADRLLRAYTTQWRNSNPTNFAAEFYATQAFTNFANADQWTNYPAFGITNIPVLVSNQFVYSPAVNRLLQLAANLYDATTTNFYPSVFRPTFWVTNENGYRNVYINGYQQIVSVSGPLDPQLTMLTLPGDVTTLANGLLGSTAVNYTFPLGANVYGVPWIIGAKKYFPNFNKFAMQDVVQISRKVQLTSLKVPVVSMATDIIGTNQMYIFSVSNSIGMDFWNSYSNRYPNPVQVVVNYHLQMMLTNDGGIPPVITNYSIYATPTYSPWPGSAWTTNNLTNAAANSFIVPTNTTVVFLTNSVLYFGSSPPGISGLYPESPSLGWETGNHDLTLPNFGLLTTNRLQVFMLDGGHVIDYAQFAGPDSSRNLNSEFQKNPGLNVYERMWDTTLWNNMPNEPWGIVNQITVSEGPGVNSLYWRNGATALDEIAGFRYYLGLSSSIDVNNPNQAKYTNSTVQVPYTPTVTLAEYISWQANDPLVHYLASDLNFQGTENFPNGPTTGLTASNMNLTVIKPNFNQKNDRYQPWGLSLMTAGVDSAPANLAFKDPLVRISDNWDFPGNKFPTVGWLGRVHRGTPWQTVYLKASNLLRETNMFGNIGTNTWAQWTGDTQLTYGQYFDAANSAPVRDRLLFDLFTTAFNDNATRGTLSVNQDHLAAWSAVFSGVMVLFNNAPDNQVNLSTAPQFQNPPPRYSVTNIQPAGPAWTNSLLGRLVNGINQTRLNFLNADGVAGTFEHLGDILSVPQFTEQSPFLNLNAKQLANGISDEMYEWLPQQTMSLLRGGGSPRYVIYCYGQALKPAPDSIYTTSGPYFGMITNYQVVSEFATRAVVRFNSMVAPVNPITADPATGNWHSQPMLTNNSAVIESFNVLPPD